MIDPAAYATDVLMTCPCIAEHRLSVSVREIESDDDAYHEDCATAVLRPYLNGDEYRQYVFRLTLHDTGASHPEPPQLFEQIAAWMTGVSRSRRLPSMGTDRQPVRLEIIEGTYRSRSKSEAEHHNTGLHSTQCRLTYYQKARK